MVGFAVMANGRGCHAIMYGEGRWTRAKCEIRKSLKREKAREYFN